MIRCPFCQKLIWPWQDAAVVPPLWAVWYDRKLGIARKKIFQPGGVYHLKCSHDPYFTPPANQYEGDLFNPGICSGRLALTKRINLAELLGSAFLISLLRGKPLQGIFMAHRSTQRKW